MDTLITRAANILCYLSEEEAIDLLVKGGAPAADAFLAVKAGAILLSDRTIRV